ncbi:MAG: LysR family transcriptional regulator [Eubacteriales bacterium]|nr:LysR family transcriptional regulator [Eubacteriales bacterium]
MNKSDLEKIIAIAEEGSMARAAQKLFITQPALSKCLTKMEDELGEALFVRRPSGVELTYSGECFIKRAYQIMRLYDEMEHEFCDLNQMQKGILKVGTAERLGAMVLPKVLKIFHTKYPNIHIEIVEASSHILEEKLLMGALDIAVLCLPLKNENVRYDVFYEDSILAIAPENHPVKEMAYEKNGGLYLPLDALRGRDYVMTKRGRKTREAAERILKYLESDYRIDLESYNIETVVRLVAGGMGMSLVPQVFADTYGTGSGICKYHLEEKYNPFWQWAVAYCGPVGELSRPSRELYYILCGKD